MKFELFSSSFFTMLRTWLLSVRLAFMVTLTGPWIRLSYNHPLACSRLQPMRGGKARAKVSFWFYDQKWPVLNASTGPLTKKPHLETTNETHQDSRSHLAMHLVVPITLGRRGAIGNGIPDVLQSTTSSTSSSSIMQLCALCYYLHQ